MAWMLLTSVKAQRLLSPTGELGQEFLTYLLNSVWVSSATTVLGVIVAVPDVYAFSRFRFPGREMLYFIRSLTATCFLAWCF
jgi:multiple sugar transport system permease protein